MVLIVTDSDEQRQVGVSTVMMLTQLNGPINSFIITLITDEGTALR
jgi:hypothetical protein